MTNLNAILYIRVGIPPITTTTYDTNTLVDTAITIDTLPVTAIVTSYLYLFSQFFKDKEIEELLGEEIKTDYINEGRGDLIVKIHVNRSLSKITEEQKEKILSILKK